jgi:hypothetical protein
VQARFTKAILEQMAAIDFPMDRIYSQTESGNPKSEVLEMLRGKHPDCVCHFVEDKLATMQKVMKLKELEAYHLYLVDWGYNTEHERQFASKSERIELINMARFGELLQV